MTLIPFLLPLFRVRLIPLLLLWVVGLERMRLILHLGTPLNTIDFLLL